MALQQDLKLPDPLGIALVGGIKKDILDDYRAKYQQFRMGAPRGAKGEISSLCDSGSLSASTAASSQSEDEIDDQPSKKPGKVDAHGIYRNSFGREGKRLQTEIVLRAGLLKKLPEVAKSILPQACHGAMNFLITDSVVDPLYGNLVLQGLQAAGIVVHKIVIPADQQDMSGESTGEPYKTTAMMLRCCDEVIGNGVSKHSCVISLGGGVVNNLCGVVAQLVYRGLALVHITTTTMGMLDASIDFKQAVNHQLGKNLLGCYYPASVIMMDPESLTTLSERHVRNGIAEALKHGLAQSEELVELIAKPLRKGNQALHDSDYLIAVCKASIEIKCPTLDYYHSSDYNEMVPQYGHAIGHAVEHISWSNDKYTPLPHGEAICVGMCVSAEIALILGLCDEDCVHQHYQIIKDCGLPAYVPEAMTAADIRRKILFDKHFVKTPAMGLPASVGCLAHNGDSYAWNIEDEILAAALAANMMRRDVGIVNLAQVRSKTTVNMVGAYSQPKSNSCAC